MWFLTLLFGNIMVTTAAPLCKFIHTYYVTDSTMFSSARYCCQHVDLPALEEPK